jgi:hypothetical protein
MVAEWAAGDAVLAWAAGGVVRAWPVRSMAADHAARIAVAGRECHVLMFIFSLRS